jgi:hypothetical protein
VIASLLGISCATDNIAPLAIGVECTKFAEDIEAKLPSWTCGGNATTSSVFCDKVENQNYKCTAKCRPESTDCDQYLDLDPEEDLICYIAETGSTYGLCRIISDMWIVGVTLSLIGSLTSNFGMQIQKLAFNKHEKAVRNWALTQATPWTYTSNYQCTQSSTLSTLPISPPSAHRSWARQVKEEGIERKTPCCIPLWVAGFSGMVFGSILDFVSLAFAAQSLLAPLAASTLVINIVQAPLIVKEKLTGLDILCTLIIATGCVFAVGFADHNTKTYSLQEQLDLWVQWNFLLWIGVVIALMVGVFFVIQVDPGCRGHSLSLRPISVYRLRC